MTVTRHGLSIAALVALVVGVMLGGCGGSDLAPRETGAGALLAADPEAPVGEEIDTAAVTWGTNLIRNPGAEASPGATSIGQDTPPIHWTRTGKLHAVQYGTSGGFPTSTSPGPKVRGVNFFSGGNNSALSKVEQTRSVAWAAEAIDLGVARYTLAGWLGGYLTDTDNARLKITFLNGSGGKLGAATIGPITPAQRANKTGLVSRTRKGPVPQGTRSIKIELIMTGGNGSYNDGYADALSLRLSYLN